AFGAEHIALRLSQVGLACKDAFGWGDCGAARAGFNQKQHGKTTAETLPRAPPLSQPASLSQNHPQNNRRESSKIVTGPSLTSSTSTRAWTTPSPTHKPCPRTNST